MKVELLGFSQGISFANKNEPINYLDFQTEDGRQFRLPVPAETLDVLMKHIYAEEEEEKVAEEAPTEGDEFGGEEPAPPPVEEMEEYPESEEDVPSI